VAEVLFPRQRAFSDEFITRSREAAKKAPLADTLRAFAASRETNPAPSIVSAFGG